MTVLEGIRKARTAYILERGMVPNVVRVTVKAEEALMGLRFDEVGDLAHRIALQGRSALRTIYGMDVLWDQDNPGVEYREPHQSRAV